MDSVQVSDSALERKVIALVAAVQFVHIVDFMMVMPLGPDFAKALGIRVSHLGVVAGAYTLAAAASGIICSFFIDRLDRKIALLISVFGLGIGTASGAWAEDFHSLLLARVFAGAFGGPAASVALALISDVVPPARRGAALGTAMMSFSLASILGVPMGLELARWGTWQTPFLVVGAMGVLVSFAIYYLLPSMKGHLANYDYNRSTFKAHVALLSQRVVLLSYLVTFSLMMSGFLVFPNIAAYVQLNLNFPRAEMGRLYLVGGLISFAVMRYVGKLVDRFGSTSLFLIGTIGFWIGLFGGFLGDPPMLGAYGIFFVFMLFGTIRNISANTLTSKVPKPADRAGFMSLQSAVQHSATAFGGIVSSRLLVTTSDGKLEGFLALVVASSILMLVAAICVMQLQKRVVTSSY